MKTATPPLSSSHRRLPLPLLALGILVLLAAAPGARASGGFGLAESSAKGTAHAYAGGAADVDGATAVYYNPAALGLLKHPELNIVGSLIKLNAKFSPTSAVDAIGEPLSGNNGGNGGQKLNFVPAAFFGAPINRSFAWGVGVYVPFGLDTDYDATSILRYEAIYTSVEVIDFNPSLAWNVTPHFSVGVGVDAEKMYAKLTNDVDAGALCFSKLGPIDCTAIGLTPQSHDIFASVAGSDTAIGWNAGLLWHDDGTHIGVAYRSTVTHNVVGTATFDNVPALFAQSGLFLDTDAQANLELPSTADFSVSQRLNPAWTVMADALYTRWDTFNQIRVLFANPAQPPSVTPEDYKNVWRFAIGTTWHYSPVWSFYGGLAYAESPVPTSTRNARLPDANRRWVSVGATYHFNPATSVTLGYAYLFLNHHIPMDNVSPSGDQVVGTWSDNAYIVALELSHKFL
jgi:long-chain fatty acid transport protein